MRTLLVALVSAALVGTVSSFPFGQRLSALAGGKEACSATEGVSAAAYDPSECALGIKSAAAVSNQKRVRGSVRGAYDATMAMCRFSCGAKAAHRERDLRAQPGVRDGQLARCPVSGVAFKADAQRPRVRLATGEYVTCCDNCATKLRKNPGRFLYL